MPLNFGMHEDPVYVRANVQRTHVPTAWFQATPTDEAKAGFAAKSFAPESRINGSPQYHQSGSKVRMRGMSAQCPSSMKRSTSHRRCSFLAEGIKLPADYSCVRCQSGFLQEKARGKK
ncbi:hypothetical protein TWF706_002732, partial [Orbilia oligospora]